ncbi:MAG TPA: LPS export ABC transporter periplasmic protein LptC [Acidisoma sp.]|jgi:lipopolysaccharide export system protein LptC|uniref:LPS export ABC transporter periplasmic protein LptC n=1 Tax=Acidisoma sp. TaxID=1872115 RepID=UPI002BFDCE85|nr:LPS export ABC transporter periplasmic protein LptC [Acidisoma sp.]HTH99985.1 LPS export ABC transporter periplasmic protein LptC [Acidisoma sp.]
MSAIPDRLQLLRQPQLEDVQGTARRIWRGRKMPSAGALKRRRRLVTWMKRLLPLAALMLLSMVMLWPELVSQHNPARVSYHLATGADGTDQGSMLKAHYEGLDDTGRPYTMTAAKAVQTDADTVVLTQPAGDMTLKSGTWLMVQSLDGLYHAKAQHLDLSNHVVLYRDDGTTVRTSKAAINLKQATASGHEKVNADGPFGTLDAQGFAITDHGSRLHFTGPAKLVLDGSP